MLWEAGSRLSRSRCITVSQGSVPTESFYMWSIKGHRATDAKYICFVNDVEHSFVSVTLSEFLERIEKRKWNMKKRNDFTKAKVYTKI